MDSVFRTSCSSLLKPTAVCFITIKAMQLVT